MKKVFYFFLLMIALISCKDSVKHFTISQTFKDYFRFKTGVWVFKLEGDTVKVDTCKLTNWEEGKMQWDAFDQEFFKYEMSSQIDRNYQVRAVADNNDIDRVSILTYDAGKWTGDAIFYHLAGSFQVEDKDKLVVLPTFKLAGKTYENVQVIEPEHSVYYKKLYFAKNYGIIRKELFDGKIYNVHFINAQQ